MPPLSRHNCCMSGKAIDDPAFPKLNPLPDGIAKAVIEKTAHMSKTSHMYNTMFSIGKKIVEFFLSFFFNLCCLRLAAAGTGVDNGKVDENGKKSGYEKFHGMEAAVKIQGRTYHFISKATQGHGLNYFTFENEAGVEEHVSEIGAWKTKKAKVEVVLAKGLCVCFFVVACCCWLVVAYFFSFV